MLRYLRQVSAVMAGVKEVTMLMWRRSANPSMSARLTLTAVDWSSTASSAPMARCSIRSTLCVNTGSMLTVPALSLSLVLMITLVKCLTTPCQQMHPPLSPDMPNHLLPHQTMSRHQWLPHLQWVTLHLQLTPIHLHHLLMSKFQNMVHQERED